MKIKEQLNLIEVCGVSVSRGVDHFDLGEIGERGIGLGIPSPIVVDGGVLRIIAVEPFHSP